MLKRLALLLWLLIPFAAHAQDNAGWEVLLIERGTFGGASIMAITPDGVAAGTVLPDELGLPENDQGIIQAALSPDRRYLALYAPSMESDEAAPITIYNIETENCCVTVENPTGMEVGAFDLGSFSPDGTQLALAYVGIDYDNTELPFAGGLLIVDAATGATVQDIPIEQVNAAIGAEGSAWALVDDWDETGIRFHPNCYACEPALEGNYSIWNPETGEFSFETGGGFYYFYGDALESTGELIYLHQNPAFPASPEPGYMPVANVVQYAPDAVLPPYDQRSEGQVIYFNPSDISLEGQVHWVMNGEAFLVADPESTGWYLVGRDGSSTLIDVPVGSRFIAGTPDGWLAALPEAGETFYNVTHFTGRDNPRELTTLNIPFAVLEAPELAPQSTRAFPIVPAPTPDEFAAILAANPTTCEGFLVSRLIPGRQGRVTPGSANNIRSGPGTAAELVGSIPGGAVFDVVSGPICGENIAWWEVNYNGLIGWTAEGQGSAYFVEPVS